MSRKPKKPNAADIAHTGFAVPPNPAAVERMTRLVRKAKNRLRYQRRYARHNPRAKAKRAHQKGYGYYEVPLNIVSSREAAYFRALCFGMGQ